jgi:putative hydrolase of the HAD superfamily
MISVLVLDYGGVLSLPQCDRQMASMARRLGAPLEEFRRAYAEHRGAYDTGLEVEEYWRRVLASMSREHLASPALLAQLVEDDIASWGYFREEVWDIARRFRASGGRTALLTNNIPPLMARLRSLGRLQSHFDVVVASCEVGVCKPDPVIFRRCLEALAVPAAEALFVDDHPPNIAEANRAGMQTLLFDGENAIPTLRRMLAIEASS